MHSLKVTDSLVRLHLHTKLPVLTVGIYGVNEFVHSNASRLTVHL